MKYTKVGGGRARMEYRYVFVGIPYGWKICNEVKTIGIVDDVNGVPLFDIIIQKGNRKRWIVNDWKDAWNEIEWRGIADEDQ